MKIKKRYFLIPLLVIGLILCISPFIFRVHAYSIMNYTAIEHGISENYCYIGAISLSSYGADSNQAPMIRLQYYDTDAPNTLVSYSAINITYNVGYDYWTINNTNNIMYDNQVYMYQIYTTQNSTRIDIYEFDFQVDNNYQVYASSISLLYTTDLAPYNWNEVVSVKAVFNCSLLGMTPYASKYNESDLLNFFNNNYKLQYNNAIYNAIYESGYNDGQAGENSITPFFNLMNGVFSLVDTILSIEIVPRIKLWYFIALPLFFLILWAVLKIWKHN